MGHPKALIEHEGGRSFLQSLASTFGKAGCAVLGVVGKDSEAVREQHPTLMLVESSFYLAGPGHGDTYPSTYVRDAGGDNRRRHGETVNCAFVDGHVRAMKYSQIIFPGVYKPWTTTAD